MRRLPPQQIEKNLSDLIDLVPELCEDLLSSVDQPLKIARDKKEGKDYLLCDYNRDGDSYRYSADIGNAWSLINKILLFCQISVEQYLWASFGRWHAPYG